MPRIWKTKVVCKSYCNCHATLAVPGRRLNQHPANEIDSEVIQLNDRGAALISSIDESFNNTVALYDGETVTPLDFGPEIPVAFFLSMNNQGIIAGTTIINGTANRGFRFDPHSGTVMLLEPLPTEPHSSALGINNKGDVLGYSFVSRATERIGVWDRQGKFKTYFVEGTPEFPTISQWLVFNDNNHIVITDVIDPPAERDRSYLVPEPGVRLNLTDFVAGMPPEHGAPARIRSINNLQDMIGRSLTPEFSSFSFLLERQPGDRD